MMDWLCTRERAIDHAHERAREVDARVIVVEGPDWTIDEIIHVDRPSGLFALPNATAPASTKSRAFAAR
jgi:hypothetical protein